MNTKPLTAWAAFSEGRLMVSEDKYYPVRCLGIYPTRREARRTAEDVRRVTITVDPTPTPQEETT